MRTRVSSKGQIVLPAEVRRQDDIEAGQEFDVEPIDHVVTRNVVDFEKAGCDVVNPFGA